MDGFSSELGVVFVAATNRADLLDPALTRPGRFDRKIRVPKPDTDARRDILQVTNAPTLFPYQIHNFMCAQTSFIFKMSHADRDVQFLNHCSQARGSMRKIYGS